MLDRFTREDIPEARRIENLPGYDAYVGQWEQAAHEAELMSPDARYLAWREGGRLTGFVMFQQFREPRVLLRRIVVQAPGMGSGRALLRAAVDWAFANSPAQAVWLQVKHGNDRAMHVYEQEGFVVDGRDEATSKMSVSRDGWAARKDSK